MSSLSLYNIEAGLLDLLTAREEVLAGEQTADTPMELEQINKALAEYVGREVAKVDGIHSYLAWAKSTAEEARAQAAAFGERARRIESGIERVKACCLDVLQAMNKKRLDGTAGRYLSIAGNGGVQPLSIQDDMLPPEYQDITVRLPRDVWRGLLGDYILPEGVQVLDVKPANGRIRAALAEGPVPGASLQPRGVHLGVR